MCNGRAREGREGGAVSQREEELGQANASVRHQTAEKEPHNLSLNPGLPRAESFLKAFHLRKKS